MPNKARPRLSLTLAAMHRPAAPISNGITKCQRRSPRRSAERPINTMNTAAARYGMALIRPMRIGSVTPLPWMIEGNQKLIAYTPLWMQKYTVPSSHTAGLRSTAPSEVDAPAGLPASSSASTRAKACFSCGLSQLACCTPSLSRNHTPMPSTTVGRPCSRNIHCQPARPPCPAEK